MSTLGQQRKMVEQLRQEASMTRRPVSECVRDMIAFMEQNREKDCLHSVTFGAERDVHMTPFGITRSPFRVAYSGSTITTHTHNSDVFVKWIGYVCSCLDSFLLTLRSLRVHAFEV
ncbi:Guanine nucleotide-binding protein subunit gamma [Fasciolopsis buskii]|uniref:Guanine nucleotide-binding protein subunit gamma n=1 Tax=Fasciolopsis buskii TaxID=27845 RepID=A0A8E0S2E6_9TREM|nr:Guanine nucleotide-binding protein subunit gamma [Fasciolopsis buski]